MSRASGFYEMIVEQLRNVEMQTAKCTVHGSCAFVVYLVENSSVNGIAMGLERFQNVTFVRY